MQTSVNEHYKIGCHYIQNRNKALCIGRRLCFSFIEMYCLAVEVYTGSQKVHVDEHEGLPYLLTTSTHAYVCTEQPA